MGSAGEVPNLQTKFQNSRRHINVAHGISKQESLCENARTSRASSPQPPLASANFSFVLSARGFYSNMSVAETRHLSRTIIFDLF